MPTKTRPVINPIMRRTRCFLLNWPENTRHIPRQVDSYGLDHLPSTLADVGVATEEDVVNLSSEGHLRVWCLNNLLV
ncbi:cytochrome P450 monooxygenase [Colletotrichum scovillei]|uniref:Cytochrome P450 monooxygenase n=1 Tax=Colletotrichum scovillei TaxID=1209932 RepID=A0A9P7RE07_9PEZI|nr:cytochrome P450 monooxygenase [Colletotrichum scovillei]KAG7075369.1 cytochrome P450 monooxygenase [Colletotrichum scovillei]KAG7082580.1 cytochrome P450 monooxygenase [Colletotrichum scovillei]